MSDSPVAAPAAIPSQARTRRGDRTSFPCKAALCIELAMVIGKIPATEKVKNQKESITESGCLGGPKGTHRTDHPSPLPLISTSFVSPSARMKTCKLCLCSRKGLRYGSVTVTCLRSEEIEHFGCGSCGTAVACRTVALVGRVKVTDGSRIGSGP
jgi:hypothetical protein